MQYVCIKSTDVYCAAWRSFGSRQPCLSPAFLEMRRAYIRRIYRRCVACVRDSRRRFGLAKPCLLVSFLF